MFNWALVIWDFVQDSVPTMMGVKTGFDKWFSMKNGSFQWLALLMLGSKPWKLMMMIWFTGCLLTLTWDCLVRFGLFGIFGDDWVNNGVDGGDWCVGEDGVVVGVAAVGQCVGSDLVELRDCVVAGVGGVEANQTKLADRQSPVEGVYWWNN